MSSSVVVNFILQGDTLRTPPVANGNFAKLEKEKGELSPNVYFDEADLAAYGDHNGSNAKTKHNMEIDADADDKDNHEDGNRDDLDGKAESKGEAEGIEDAKFIGADGTYSDHILLSAKPLAKRVASLLHDGKDYTKTVNNQLKPSNIGHEIESLHQKPDQRDGKPVTCCVCEGPLRGGFCSFCDSRAKNSYTYDPNAYSFNNTSNNFNHLPQPQFETYLCDKCGNNSHYGYDCQPQFPFAYKQEPSYNQNYNEPEEIPELMYKLREDVRNIREELAEYIDSPIWNCPIFFYDEDEEYTIQYREYLEKSPDAVTTVLPTEEPEYSLSMGYEHLNMIPETKSDEVTEYSAKNLLPVPSECEVTSEDESKCDMPAKDESFSVFTTFSNPLFDNNDDVTSSDDESLSEEVPIEEFYSNPLFDDDKINSDKLDPHCFNVESDFVESLLNRDTFIDYSPKFDFLLKEFSGELAHIYPEIKEADFDFEEEIFQDNDSQREEIDIVSGTYELLPSSFKNDDYDPGETDVVEELLVDNPTRRSKNELSDFNQDDSLFPRPPSEPPDVEFDFEPDAGEEISVVMNDNDDLIDDECFDPGGEIDVSTNVEDDDYFPFMFVIRIFLPYLIYPEVSHLLLSAGSEDTIFDPGISV
nr:paired amphipathic helix protein Sin3-like 2 isoform X1 [Tanacetum cinerariifolium]